MFEVKLIESISEVSPAQWNALADKNYPFTSWEFLHALESSGAVCTETGWQPQHLLLFENKVLVAALPMYLKNHSQGEYVFDYSWANTYDRHGYRYYPKLLTAIPFTPCQGERLCVVEKYRKDKEKCNQFFLELLQVIQSLCERYGISSWHCLFPEKAGLNIFASDQLLLRQAVQFQWFNRDYSSFDHYLESFTSKRRKNVRRERRAIVEQGIQVQRLNGAEISAEHWQQFFIFYQATYRKRGMREYLNLDFFSHIAESMTDHLLMVVAMKDQQFVAAALSVVGADTLYGRYWGCLAEYGNLHFELCYYQGLEFCIENGLRCFNSGAQGEHKIARGFEPVMTYSLHWVVDEDFREAIRVFLQEENNYIESHRSSAEDLLPFKEG